jgi:hypothetical protein
MKTEKAVATELPLQAEAERQRAMKRYTRRAKARKNLRVMDDPPHYKSDDTAWNASPGWTKRKPYVINYPISTGSRLPSA